MFFQNKNNEVYFIAEIGVNHEGNLDLAKQMIREAAEAGANAVKFQTYKADKLAARNSPSYWDRRAEPTSTQFELFQKYDSFNRSDYEELAKYCTEFNVDFCSTPFDVDCVSWLVDLMPFVKIASADLTNKILLEEIVQYRKPVVMSVGAASLSEINASLDLLLKHEIEVVLLHCVLNYPTELSNAFLQRIKTLQLHYGESCLIGYSDHVAPSSARDDQILLAYGMGVRIFEKHFTYDNTLKGNDHYHAMNKNDLKSLITRLKSADIMVKQSYNEEQFLESQQAAILHARRSLYFNKSLPINHVVTKSDIIPKRPGNGISVMDYQKIIGKKLKKNVEADEKIDWTHFE